MNKPCQGKIPEPFTGIATNGDFRAHVASFRSYTGAHLRLVEFYNPFPGPFRSAEAQQIVAMHALPLIQLNPRRISMAQVASGGYDSDIRSYAEQVKAFRCHVVLSFGHEMNGWWYPWGLPDTPPRVFKAAWRHFHDVFAAAGVRNVIWSWDPTHQYSQYRPGEVATPASEWYPGNKYVNWIGFDGYIGSGQTFKEHLQLPAARHQAPDAQADLPRRDRRGRRQSRGQAGGESLRRDQAMAPDRAGLVRPQPEELVDRRGQASQGRRVPPGHREVPVGRVPHAWSGPRRVTEFVVGAM